MQRHSYASVRMIVVGDDGQCVCGVLTLYYHTGMGSVEESNTQLKQCTICLEYGQKRLDPRMLPCGHAYCLNCLKEHKKVNKELKCPGCRQVHFTC